MGMLAETKKPLCFLHDLGLNFDNGILQTSDLAAWFKNSTEFMEKVGFETIKKTGWDWGLGNFDVLIGKILTGLELDPTKRPRIDQILISTRQLKEDDAPEDVDLRRQQGRQWGSAVRN